MMYPAAWLPKFENNTFARRAGAGGGGRGVIEQFATQHLIFEGAQQELARGQYGDTYCDASHRDGHGIDHSPSLSAPDRC